MKELLCTSVVPVTFKIDKKQGTVYLLSCNGMIQKAVFDPQTPALFQRNKHIERALQEPTVAGCLNSLDQQNVSYKAKHMWGREIARHPVLGDLRESLGVRFTDHSR